MEKINGRKRHIFVDTHGNILFVCVLPAHVSDSDGAYDLLDGIRQRYPTITRVWADGAYMANVEFFADTYTITIEIRARLGTIRLPPFVEFSDADTACFVRHGDAVSGVSVAWS